MRLSTEQIAAIKQETEHFFGAQAEVLAVRFARGRQPARYEHV